MDTDKQLVPFSDVGLTAEEACRWLRDFPLFDMAEPPSSPRPTSPSPDAFVANTSQLADPNRRSDRVMDDIRVLIESLSKEMGAGDAEISRSTGL